MIGSPAIFAFSWANPWLLWGTALAVAPILIHLLHRRTYRETDWAAMRFLIEAARKKSRRSRLEQLILLAARVLVLLLIALAFAEPMLQAARSMVRAGVPKHRVLIVDASLSMGLETGGRSAFDRAREQARSVVEQSLAGDAFHLVSMAGRGGRVVIREAAFEPDTVLREIAALELTDEPADLLGTLAAADSLLADPQAPNDKELILFSDCQRFTWEGDSGRRGELTAAWKRIADRAGVSVVDVGAADAANVAITGLRALDPFVMAEKPVRLQATIRSFGQQAVKGLRAELHVDQYRASEQVIDLPAGGEQSVEFEHVFHAAGDRAVEVRIPPDRLAADDRRYCSVSVVDHLRVLIVNGKTSIKPDERASHFVRTVLSPSTARAPWEGLTEPHEIDESELAEQDLAGFGCVILCDVALLTPTEADLLRAYVEGGGGLIIALGDRVKIENYNQLLRSGGGGLLPATLGDRRQSAATGEQGGFTFDARALDHPILAPFRGNPQAGLNRAVTLTYLRMQPTADVPARVVLRFDTGDPAIIERPVGLGRCLVVATSIDVSWSAWPVHPTFPPIMHEMVRFASAGRSTDRQPLVGDPIVQVLPARNAHQALRIKLPDGSERAIKPSVSKRSAEIAFADTRHPGLYALVGAANSSTKLFAVNVDPRESDPARLDAAAMRKTVLAGVPAQYHTRWVDAARPTTEGAPEQSALVSWLLAATVVLLLVEPMLAWDFRYGIGLLAALAGCGLLLAALRRPDWIPPAGTLILLVGLALPLLLDRKIPIRRRTR